MEIKREVNKWDLIKLKKILHSKGNYKQGEKTSLIMGENNSKWNKWQRINFQNIQAAHTTQCQNKQKTQPKTFFQIRHYRWLKYTQHHSLLEKCKSQLQWDITLHRSEWPSSESLQTINAGEGVEKHECFCTVAGNVNWYSHYGRQYQDSLKN